MSDKTIDEMIEEATMDTYGEAEQISGWECVLEENVVFPFKAEFLGMTVLVTGVAVAGNQIEAVCKMNRKKGRVNLLELAFDPKEVFGSEWIKAYRFWQKRGG